MATTFQVGTLFDHFCAKLHVGAGLDRDASMRLRQAMFAAIRDSERATLVDAFRDGGQLFGRSLSEAPEWVSRRVQKAAELSASRVEERLSRLGGGYLRTLLGHFEQRWNADQSLVR